MRRLIDSVDSHFFLCLVAAHTVAIHYRTGCLGT